MRTTTPQKEQTVGGGAGLSGRRPGAQRSSAGISSRSSNAAELVKNIRSWVRRGWRTEGQAPCGRTPGAG